MNSILHVIPQNRNMIHAGRQLTNQSARTLHFAACSRRELEDRVDAIETAIENDPHGRKEKALKIYNDGMPVIYHPGLYMGQNIGFSGPDMLQLFKIALDKKPLLIRILKGPVFDHQVIPGYVTPRYQSPLSILAIAGFLSRHPGFPNAFYLTKDGEKELKRLDRNEGKDPATSRLPDIFRRLFDFRKKT
jgi:hypothetical protein